MAFCLRCELSHSFAADQDGPGEAKKDQKRPRRANNSLGKSSLRTWYEAIRALARQAPVTALAWLTVADGF
jgi:hypothetical protein